MNTSNPPIRLIIADDHVFFRDGLRFALNKHAENQIEIVGEAENGKELINIVKQYQPDIVLTDIKMPVIDGMQATKLITSTSNKTGIIALSGFDEGDLIYDMLDAGARGYLLKNSPREEILDAILTVHNGKMYYCNSTSKSLIKLIGPSRYNSYNKLAGIAFCAMEIDIIKLICKQRITKEIAQVLGLSVKSVENYSKRIKDKIEARNMAGIVLYALKNNIVSMHEI